MNEILETSVNLVAAGTQIDGTVQFNEVTRVFGTIRGRVVAREGCVLVIGESGIVEGDIQADTLFVDGFVHGDIRALTRVVVSRTGRVVGNIETPSLQIDFGAHFEGLCGMENARLLGSSPQPAGGLT